MSQPPGQSPSGEPGGNNPYGPPSGEPPAYPSEPPIYPSESPAYPSSGQPAYPPPGGQGQPPYGQPQYPAQQPPYPPGQPQPGYPAPGAYPAPGSYGAPYGAGPATSKNNIGVWALVLGIVSLVCCSIFTGIPAIILGLKSRQAAAAGEANNGAFGTAGLVLGIVSIAFAILSVIVYLANPDAFDFYYNLNT